MFYPYNQIETKFRVTDDGTKTISNLTGLILFPDLTILYHELPWQLNYNHPILSDKSAIMLGLCTSVHYTHCLNKSSLSVLQGV